MVLESRFECSRPCTDIASEGSIILVMATVSCEGALDGMHAPGPPAAPPTRDAAHCHSEFFFLIAVFSGCTFTGKLQVPTKLPKVLLFFTNPLVL